MGVGIKVGAVVGTGVGWEVGIRVGIGVALEDRLGGLLISPPLLPPPALVGVAVEIGCLGGRATQLITSIRNRFRASIRHSDCCFLMVFLSFYPTSITRKYIDQRQFVPAPVRRVVIQEIWRARSFQKLAMSRLPGG